MLDLNGAVARSREIRERDDLAALEQAVRHSARHAVEVWQGPRLVARVKLGNAPLDATDLHSL